MSVLAWLAGVGLALSVALGVSGLFPSAPITSRPALGRRLSLPDDLPRRVLTAAGGAALFGLITGWPVAALAGAVGGYFLSELTSPRSERQAPIERTEAVAEWTEQLRDTMAAAAGLGQAIIATAPLAPAPIRAEITALAARASRERLVPLLGELGEALADPTADLVITALSLAAAGEGQDLGEVLSALAVSARDDATMRRYIDASRARTRTAVRIITAIAILSLVGLLAFGRSYLAPYGSAGGQVALGIVLACYGAGVAILNRMAVGSAPDRLLAKATGSLSVPVSELAR